MFPSRADDIVYLIRYVFSDENIPYFCNGIGSSRELVVSFAACQGEALLLSDVFNELLEEGDSFVSNFQVRMMEGMDKD